METDLSMEILLSLRLRHFEIGELTDEILNEGIELLNLKQV